MSSLKVNLGSDHVATRSRENEKDRKSRTDVGRHRAWRPCGSCCCRATDDRQTPKGWSYELSDGQRVPKDSRVTNPDGSWREEIRQGNCITVKQHSPTGEYKETRQCNPS